MAPLYLYNGKLLVKNNALATSANCCCSCLPHECSGSECHGGWDGQPFAPYRLNITFPGPTGTLDLLGPLDLGPLCDYGKLLPSCYYGSTLPDLWVRKNAVRYDGENLQFCIEYSQAVDRTDFWKTVVPNNNVWHELILIESGDFWYSLKEFKQPYCNGICGSVDLTAGSNNNIGITVNSFEVICDDGITGCCIGDAAYATMVLSSQCNSAGGHQYFVVNQQGCPECGGACCLPDGTCQNQTSKSQCETILGGSWHSGATCGQQQGCCCNNGNCGWIVKDTTNNLVLHSGPVNPGAGDLDLVLTNLPTTWIPWGYYYKTFNAALIFTCGGNEVKTLQTWSVNITNCGTGADRYPATTMNNDWTYECSGEPCGKTYNLSAGGLTRTGNVSTFDGGSSKSVVDHKYEYSNIFNWVGGSWDKNLPDNTTNVTISAECLHDSTQAAVCKDLTISGNFKFGISITSNGRVLVESSAHVIDEKYNTACTSRGHITCNNTGNVSTIELSDGITYEYNGDIIFNGAYLSGTLEYTGTNKVAATFNLREDTNGFAVYSKITDNATITGGEHIFLKACQVRKLDFEASSLNIPIPVYNGKWIFTGGSANWGVISTSASSAYVRFFNYSANAYSPPSSVIQGTITTTEAVHFYDNSSNGGIVPDAGSYNQCGDYAIVTNNAVFHNNAWNSAKVGGNAEFYDNSYYVCGTIVGSVDLYNNSYVATGSTLTNDDIECWDTSYNKGTITGDPIFNENSYNDTAGIINGTPEFYNESSTFGTITSSNTVNFHNKASIQNGTVNGNCSFVDNSHIWKGTVNGNCSFADYAGCGANYLSPSGPWLYNGGGGLCIATVNGNTIFANNTLNNGCIRVPDNGSCVFSDSSANDGGYITKADGTPGSNNSLYSVIFNGTSRNGVSRTTDVYGGNVTFNSGTGNGYPGVVGANVNAYNVVFNGTGSIGSVQNYGYVTGSNSVSMTYGYNNNNASITGPTTLTNSENSTGATITGNTSFVSSKNYGTVTGDADFNATSCNSGTVTGTITCSGGACNPGDPPTC